MRITAFLAVLFLALSPAHAQQTPAPYPNAAAVVNQTDEPVEFQDEVKAVSYSKSTQGYYLSFGNAYPKQILSVWIDGKIYAHLPYHSSMVGRTVQISGQIETSPTGPVINLASAGDFHVMATDESILGKPKLDGKQDRAQFETAVWQSFKREDFATLETLGAELRESKETTLHDGSWLSEAFLNSFRLSPTASSEKYAGVEQIITKWGQAYPSSIVLPLIKAAYHIDLAWKWRGTGNADKVTPEGGANFQKELAVARQILESYRTSKSFPEYFGRMQEVALGQSWSREEYEQLFVEAVNTQPDYYTLYSHKAHYLLPRWHGQKGEWERFAESERQKHGAGAAGDALYAHIALSMYPFYDNVFRDSAISWNTTASGMEYLIRQYPDSRYLKSRYANLAWKVGDRARLTKMLPAIKADPDMTVWVNLENVASG